MKKDITLLLIGALISLGTATMTDYFNERRDKAKNNAQKRMELNDQLSKDLGKRMYLTYEIFKKRRDDDSTLHLTLDEFRQSKLDWNLKIYSYQSLLRHYYGEPYKERFINTVFDPMIALGKRVEQSLKDSATYTSDFNAFRETTIAFISDIYAQVDE